MIRKMLMATGVVVGLLGLNLTAQEAKADTKAYFSYTGNNFGFGVGNYGPAYYPAYSGPAFAPPVIQHYHVYYRDCSWGRWQLYGTYGSHHQAHTVANRLEWQGLDARVQHH